MALLEVYLGFVACLLLLTTVTSQTPFFVPDTITSGGNFTVYCDASRVTGLDSSVSSITKLTISRIKPAAAAEIFAQYSSYGLPNVTYIPPGRIWNHTFGGGNGGTNNRNTMYAMLQVYDAKCEDAGFYYCNVSYLSGNIEATAVAQKNVTAISGISDYSLSISYVNGFPNNQPQLNEGDNITISCQCLGANTVQHVWQEYDANTNTWMTYNTVQRETPVAKPSTSGCPQYKITSSVSLQVTVYDNERTFMCTASFNNQAESSNITLSIYGGTTAGPQGSQAGPSSDVGMIVGIVIGCVIAIVIIVLIVFFVLRYRKKKASSSKDNEDHHDGGNVDPPVFYPSTKPSKPSKEEKDSKTPHESMAHDQDYDHNISKKDKKPRDRSPFYDDNYNHEQESTGGGRNPKPRNFDSRRDKYHTQDEHHYASTDISQSGDESADQSDVPLDKDKLKPRAKRRSQVPHRDNRDAPKPLHYAELDLSRRKDGSESGSDFGKKREIPVEYAEIRVLSAGYGGDCVLFERERSWLILPMLDLHDGGQYLQIPTGMTNEALDTSYDSKDSVSKGPPRYANTESDQGPPRYEKETHRGRHNKSYEEDEKDRNGGHGRSHRQPHEREDKPPREERKPRERDDKQPREREERRHKTRDYDEPPKRHNYSTDDGTDGRVDFGDPNMGTSI